MVLNTNFHQQYFRIPVVGYGGLFDTKMTVDTTHTVKICP